MAQRLGACVVTQEIKAHEMGETVWLTDRERHDGQVSARIAPLTLASLHGAAMTVRTAPLAAATTTWAMMGP